MIKATSKMYTAEVLLRRALEFGILLTLAPERQLKYSAPPGAITPHVKEVLRQHKELLIEYLLNYCLLCGQPVEYYDDDGLPNCGRCCVLHDAGQFETVICAEHLLNFLADYTSRLHRGHLVALDLETTGLDRYQAKIVTVQLGRLGQVHILDVRAYYSLSAQEQQIWKTAFQRLFGVPGVTWLGHHLKFDWLFLAQHFGVKPGATYDTMIVEQCLYNGKSGVKLGMKDAAARYGLQVSKEEQTSTVDLDKTPGWEEPFREEQIAYMVQDVEVPHQIYAAQRPLIVEQDIQRVVDLEHAALRAVIAMEARGALIDRVQVENIAARKRQRQADLEQYLLPVLEPAYQQAVRRKAHAQQACFWADELPASKKTFKLSSSEHLRVALAEIGVQVADTKAETLEAAVGLHSCLPDLLEWKKLQTALTTFCTKLPAHIKADGRIHADFHTVSSGRYVTSQPNLQAIPKAREGEPVEEDPRRCIVAAPGHQLLAADLSTIELRILAEMANDATMLDLLTKEDLHAETAKLMFHLPPETDTRNYLVQGKSVRQIAKQINFGLIYGMGALRLSNTTGVDLETAKELMTRYFATYRGVSAYLKRSGREALRRGYAVSLSGRRRSFPMGLESQSEAYGTYERSAKNHPIQGTNADILKRALVLLSEHLPEEVFVVLTIHDEIVLESPEARIEEATGILQTCLLEACRDFLKVVAIPTPEVLVADYWKKD